MKYTLLVNPPTGTVHAAREPGVRVTACGLSLPDGQWGFMYTSSEARPCARCTWGTEAYLDVLPQATRTVCVSCGEQVRPHGHRHMVRSERR